MFLQSVFIVNTREVIKILKDNTIIDSAMASIENAMKKTDYDVDNMNIWEWWSGVCLYGVIIAHEKTGDAKYMHLLKKWTDKNINDRQNGSVNRVIPCCVPDYLDFLGNTNKYDGVIEEYVNWCLNDSVRTSNGGFAHVWGPSSVTGLECGPAEAAHQLWADSLMMACLFMMRRGKRACPPLFDEAVRQIKIHIDVLYNPIDRLCYHAYDCKTEKNLGRYWARGNGWIVAVLAEYLRIADKSDADYEYLKNVFCKIMERALALKNTDGMLRTVIDCDNAYTEESGTLLFGYAALIGCKLKILGTEFYEWVRDIRAGIEMNENGTVKYISGGTGPDSLEKYLSVPFGDAVYGAGIVIMFVTEYMNL